MAFHAPAQQASSAPTAALKPANPTLNSAMPAKRCSTRPACLFIRGNTQSPRGRFAGSSENERRPKDAAPSQLRPWKRFGRLRTPHARIAAHRSSRRTISALAGLARSSFNVVQGNYGGLRQGRKSPLKHLAKVPDARNERCWFHIFARKLGYENPNLWGACRDR